LAASKEYEDAIIWKRLYEETALGFIDLIRQALDGCEKKGLPLSDRAKFLNLVQKADETLQRISRQRLDRTKTRIVFIL
jgi:DNA-binding transcriptional MerR regulator